MKVMTYNICRGTFGSLEAVADTIATAAPDVVLLQEVDIQTTRARGVDQLDFLASRLGMNGVFGKAWDHLGGQAGSAILSRYPLSDVEIFPLYRGRAKTPEGREEPRICFRAKVHHPAGALSAYSVHFGVIFTGHSPGKQAAQLASIVKDDPLPVIAAGDYNHFPNHPVVRKVAEHLRDASPLNPHATVKERHTFPSPYPQVCLDYILHSDSFASRDHAILDSTASDHRPVVSTLSAGESP